MLIAVRWSMPPKLRASTKPMSQRQSPEIVRYLARWLLYKERDQGVRLTYDLRGLFMLEYIMLGASCLIIALLLTILVKASKPSVAIVTQMEALGLSIQSLKLDLGKLEGGLQTLGQSLGGQLQGLVQSTTNSLETIRTTIDQKLTQAVSESRSGREELQNAFGTFEVKLEHRLSSFETSLGGRFESIQTTLHNRLEQFSKGIANLVSNNQEESASARKELAETLSAFRTEVTQAVSNLSAETLKARETLIQSAATFEMRIQERFEALTETNQQTLESLKTDMGTQLSAMSTALREQLEGNGTQLKNQLSTIQESVGQQMANIAQGSQQTAEQLRSALNDRLAAIQSDNTIKLEEMRRTVDEKLHATLEQRLGQSFQLVSDRLEQVHRGLGEMQTLAAGVGDLKRVLTNVKARGTWGEVQLEAMIEQILTPDQFQKNIATRPDGNERVEIAIRLPGKAEDSPVWLPIDAKFPVEDYQRLVDAHEQADIEQVEVAAKALETRIRQQAKAIREKYVAPPYTTDFAVMYLPTEGLYAEVLRRPGLQESIQQDHRVMIAGPTNLAAMLNSLQMGFRTLAIEKRSSEVWALLAAVKTEFSKFGDVVAATQKKLEAATNQFSQVGVRARAIQRKLRDVEALPAPQDSLLMVLPASDMDEEVEEGV